MSDPLSSVRRHLPLVLAVTLLGAGLAALLTFLTPRTYTSSIRLFVTAARPTDTTAAYEGNLFSQQRVASYAEILTSRELAQSVVDELKLPMTADDVASEVSATPVPDTVVLDVVVTDSSARRAESIAASLGRQFTGRVTALETPTDATTSTVAVKTIQAAGYDPTPAGPDLTGNLWRGAAIGLAVGLLLALLRGRLDRRLRTDEGIREAAGVGLVGRAYEDRKLSRKHLVTALPPDSPTVDAYRAIAAGLQQADDAVRPRVLLVAGCMPGDGASTVAVNVAVSLARLGGRVLLVDADLRRPRAAGYLGLSGRPGLTEVLSDAFPLGHATRQWGGASLTVLPAGGMHPNPGDLLGSAGMRTLLEELRDSYDVVVIDAPPVLSVADAALMGALADGCLLVTRYGRTRSEHLAEAMAGFTRVHAAVLGVVLNRVPRGHAVAPVGGHGYRADGARASAARRAATGAVPASAPAAAPAAVPAFVPAGTTERRPAQSTNEGGPPSRGPKTANGRSPIRRGGSA